MSEAIIEGPGQAHLVSGGLALASASTLPLNIKQTFASQNVNEDQLLRITYPLVHEGRNGNGDVFTADEMRKAYKTLVGTPLGLDHQRTVASVVGGQYEARLEHDANGLVIIVDAFIWADLYPDVARKISTGFVNGVSMEAAFPWAERIGMDRVLHDFVFVGAGLCLIPADNKARTKLLSKASYTPEMVVASTIAVLHFMKEKGAAYG